MIQKNSHSTSFSTLKFFFAGKQNRLAGTTAKICGQIFPAGIFAFVNKSRLHRCTGLSAANESHFHRCTGLSAANESHFHRCTGLSAANESHFHRCTGLSAANESRLQGCTEVFAINEKVMQRGISIPAVNGGRRRSFGFIARNVFPERESIISTYFNNFINSHIV